MVPTDLQKEQINSTTVGPMDSSDLLGAAFQQWDTNETFIHRVPETVLEEILLTVVSGDFLSELPSTLYRLGSVCSRWYSIIQGSARFWTSIDPSRGIAFVKHFISKSRSASLDLQCSSPIPVEVIPLITRELYRCRSIRMEISKVGLEMLTSILDHEDLHQMEDLYLHCMATRSKTGSHESGHSLNTPRLKCLYLSAANMPLHHINIQAPLLTSLKIESGLFHQDSYTSYINTFTQCPQLENVIICGIRSRSLGDGDIQITPKSVDAIHLHRLCAFTLTWCPTSLSIALLSTIRAPRCTRLIVYTPSSIDLSSLPSDSIVPYLLSFCTQLHVSKKNTSEGLFSIASPKAFFYVESSESQACIAQMMRLINASQLRSVLGACIAAVGLLTSPQFLNALISLIHLELHLTGQNISPVLYALGPQSASSGNWPCPRLDYLRILNADCTKGALLAFAAGRFAVGGLPGDSEGPTAIRFEYVVDKRRWGPKFDKWVWRTVEAEFEAASTTGKFHYELGIED